MQLYTVTEGVRNVHVHDTTYLPTYRPTYLPTYLPTYTVTEGVRNVHVHDTTSRRLTFMPKFGYLCICSHNYRNS